MSVKLEIICETIPGDELAISGADASVGEWDLSKAVRAATSEAAYPTWSAEVAIPAEGSEFKLVILRNGEGVWEPIDVRRWPGERLLAGTLLQTRYGDAKTCVQASADLHRANARSSKCLDGRRGSELQANLDRKGDNSYYYAHTRDFEVPEEAKIISGPGLITGGAPVLLETGGTVDAEEDDRVVWLKDYSWMDKTGKVKVYVNLDKGVLPAVDADRLVEARYASHNVELTIQGRPRRKLRIEKLNAELKVDSCSTRVEADKSRVVLELAKKRETTWYSLTKK